MKSCDRWLACGAVLGLLAGSAATAMAQTTRIGPHVGALFPAGGQAGTTVHVLVYGQNLRNASAVSVTGTGITVSGLKTYKPNRNIDNEVREYIRFLIQARRAELNGKPPPVYKPPKDADPTKPPPALPDIPYVENIPTFNLRELNHFSYLLLSSKKNAQPNPQLADLATFDLDIAPNTPPGERELRLMTREGLTNPLRFEIGSVPEDREYEPNEANLPKNQDPPEVLTLPVLVNGQILPGDVDRFRFNARAGQQLVVQTRARALIPFLADAVPGWFQITVALFNDKGKEVAFAGAFRFDPDPVLVFKVPADGIYQLEVRDSLFRGREDFIYRIAIGELPFITGMNPVGATAGRATGASLTGFNLPSKKIEFDTHPGTDPIRQARLAAGTTWSNSLPYAVDELPTIKETEPNDSPSTAMAVPTSVVIDGHIQKPGDLDCYRFEATAGSEVVADINARRLLSPMDSVVVLTDAAGKTLAWNDDYEEKEGELRLTGGIQTHAADSYLRAQIPLTGTYQIRVTDSQGQGGEAYAYRLRISPPRPGYELRVSPSTLNLRTNQPFPVDVYALRQDGFAGPIKLALKNAPENLRLDGAVIPEGTNHVTLTITATGKPGAEPAPLALEGLAPIDGQEVVREALPTDDTMQAFLYRHLLPAQSLMGVVLPGRGILPYQFDGRIPVKLHPGGGTHLHLKNPQGTPMPLLRLELRNPPPGISLGETSLKGTALKVELACAPESKSPSAGNLIFEVYPEPPKDAANPPKQRPASLGFLPAVPFVLSPP